MQPRHRRRSSSYYAHHLLTRLKEKLLKQPAQLQPRTLAAVAHDRCRDVARAIDLPLANRPAAQSRIAPRAGRTALSLLAGGAASAGARQHLPARTRVGTGGILERDEAPAVEGDDVQILIVCGLVKRAAHGDALAVAAGSSEAAPDRLASRVERTGSWRNRLPARMRTTAAPGSSPGAATTGARVTANETAADRTAISPSVVSCSHDPNPAMPWDHGLVRRQSRLDFRLLRGGGLTPDDRRTGDAYFAQSITDRRRVGRAADRAARRNQVRDPHQVRPDHVADDHAVGMRIWNIVEVDLDRVVLKRHRVLYVDDLRWLRLLC